MFTIERRPNEDKDTWHYIKNNTIRILLIFFPNYSSYFPPRTFIIFQIIWSVIYIFFIHVYLKSTTQRIYKELNVYFSCVIKEHLYQYWWILARNIHGFYLNKELSLHFSTFWCKHMVKTIIRGFFMSKDDGSKDWTRTTAS